MKLRHLLCAALATAAPAALGQDVWPAKPIRVIVPFTAGGAADVSARVVGARLGEVLKQPLVIENRAGSGGILALELVKNALPDGYTLVILANSNATKPATIPNLPWNLDRDFAY